jgi:hypothetical protein
VLTDTDSDSDDDSKDSQYQPDVFQNLPRSRRSTESVTTTRTKHKTLNLEAAIHNGVVSMSTPESVSNISFDYLTVSAVFRFMLMLSKYAARNHQRPPVAPRVAPDVRAKILACHRVRCQDELEFIELPERKVWKFLQMALKLLSVSEFATSLRKASRFPRQSKNTLIIENYNRFYGDLVAYTRLFLRVFVFLSHKNTDNIPVVDNKPGGLIRIYLYGIPGEFTNRVMSQLRETRPDSIQSFIEDTFMPMVNDLAQNLRTVKKVSPFLDPVPSLKPKTDPRPANSRPPIQCASEATGHIGEILEHLHLHLPSTSNHQSSSLLMSTRKATMIRMETP